MKIKTTIVDKNVGIKFIYNEKEVIVINLQLIFFTK